MPHDEVSRRQWGWLSVLALGCAAFVFVYPRDVSGELVPARIALTMTTLVLALVMAQRALGLPEYKHLRALLLSVCIVAAILAGISAGLLLREP